MHIPRSSTRNGAHLRRDGRPASTPKPVLIGLLAVGLVATGCSASASALGVRTARVTIDGTVQAEQPIITCVQSGWTWAIETEQKSPGFTAQVSTGGEVKPLAVQFTDLGGFTGGFSTATTGDAEATMRDGDFTITGTADGSFDGKYRDTGTAKFEIRTNC